MFLAICGGYQMLGQYYKTWDGVQLDFIGAINVHTIGAKERMIGNYMYRTTPESSGSIVVGFENHSGKTYLGEDVAPLGMMIKGYGNNGEDQHRGRTLQQRVRHLLATARCCRRIPCCATSSCRPRSTAATARPSRS